MGGGGRRGALVGVLTSVSPCPWRRTSPHSRSGGRWVVPPCFDSALSYTAGVRWRTRPSAPSRLWTVFGTRSLQFLQRHLNQILGPLLVLVGMHLLGLVNFGFSTERATNRSTGGWPNGAHGERFFSACSSRSRSAPFPRTLFREPPPPLGAVRLARCSPGPLRIGSALPVVLIAVAGAYGLRRPVVRPRAWRHSRVGARRRELCLLGVGIYLSIRFVSLPEESKGMNAKAPSIGFVGGGRITAILLSALARNPGVAVRAVVSDSDPEVRRRLLSRFPGLAWARTTWSPPAGCRLPRASCTCLRKGSPRNRWCLDTLRRRRVACADRDLGELSRCSEDSRASCG